MNSPEFTPNEEVVTPREVFQKIAKLATQHAAPYATLESNLPITLDDFYARINADSDTHITPEQMREAIDGINSVNSNTYIAMLNDKETGMRVHIGYSRDERVKSIGAGDFTEAPDQLLFPAVYYYVDGGKTKIEVTSPYGRTDQEVLGTDNNLYYISNIYYFDENSGYKYIEIKQETQSPLSTDDLSDVDAQKLDITPSEQDTQYIPPSAAELLQISQQLDRISNQQSETASDPQRE